MGPQLKQLMEWDQLVHLEKTASREIIGTFSLEITDSKQTSF